MTSIRFFPTLAILVGATLIGICAATSHAGQMWTDADGDGLPDSSPLIRPPCAALTIDLWVDSQSFQFTNFWAWAGWPAGHLKYIDGSGVILAAGCTPDS